MKYVTFDFGSNGGTYVVELTNISDDFPVEAIEDATANYLEVLEEDLEPTEIISDVLRSFPDINYMVHTAYNIKVD